VCILSCPTSSIANSKTCTYSADNFWLTNVFKAASGNQKYLFRFSNIVCRPVRCFRYMTLSWGWWHRRSSPGWLAVILIFASSWFEHLLTYCSLGFIPWAREKNFSEAINLFREVRFEGGWSELLKMYFDDVRRL